MTEKQWVDADQALDEAAAEEGFLTGSPAPGWHREERELSDGEVAEMVEEAHSAGD